MQEGGLDLGEVSRHREQLGGRSPSSLEPAPQCLRGDRVALPVAEPECIEDAALGAVEPQGILTAVVATSGTSGDNCRRHLPADPCGGLSETRGSIPFNCQDSRGLSRRGLHEH